MKILVTGFKPFLGEKINPSEKLALELDRTHINIESLILPVEFEKSFEILKTHLLKKPLPQYLIMIGQAAGRKNICFEKIGLNWIQTEQCDEAGVKPAPSAIDSSRELALMSTFPIDLICTELKKQNLPVDISFSAGTFVCNDLYFRILNEFKNLKSVFIHVPLLPEQVTDGDLKSSLDFAKQFDVFDRVIKGL